MYVLIRSKVGEINNKRKEVQYNGIKFSDKLLKQVKYFSFFFHPEKKLGKFQVYQFKKSYLTPKKRNVKEF